MIVRPLPDGQLLCIHQTSHALMAEEFCRRWGNTAFAHPQPYSAVMLGIAQHDSGWYEWELTPKLRSDGYPEDFVHESDLMGKLALWRQGIARVYAQHPFAALLQSRHAVLLYSADLQHGPPAELRRHIEEFIAEQATLLATVRRQFGADSVLGPALTDQAIEANTRLLKFGDSASLQVLMPWANEQTLSRCPADYAGTFTAIRMNFDDALITFDPWPYAAPEFEVAVHGKLLRQTHFQTRAAYHDALASAPYLRMTWRVAPR